MENKCSHKPTLRVLGILRAVSQTQEGLSLTELSAQIDSPKSSLFPIVHTLAKEGFLSLQPATSRYRLGIAAFETGQKYVEQMDILQQIRSEMRKIVLSCYETCHFGILEQGNVLYILKEDSPEPIRMVSSVGKQLPAYGTGIGKALLSGYTSDQLKALYPNGLTAMTPFTITNFDLLAKQLAQVAKEGVAYEKEESNLHIQCIAVPLQNHGKTVAALSVAIPTFRADEKKLSLAKSLLIESKQHLDRLLQSANIQSLH